MSLAGIQRSEGVGALEAFDAPPAQHAPTTAHDSAVAWSGRAEQPPEKPFDLFEALGQLFDGGAQGKDGNAFDLGALLASIFDLAGTQAKKGGTLPHDSQQTGVQERVSVSGATGDEHLRAEGRASAEAHALARSSSEVFCDGRNGVGVRGGAEASIGASAEAAGSVTTDIGSIDGRAKVSAELYARAQGEARAGPTGASATGLVEAGAMAKAEAESNLQLGDGLVQGHAEAHAEAGAGGKATGKVGVSFDPPEAVVSAKAESFAGARAGYSAKGGAAGLKYGIEAEVWAGAGAKVEINGGLTDDGKFKVDFCIGASLGVGCMVRFSIEFDLKEFARTVGKVAGAVFGGVFKAVAGLFGGGKGDGSHARQVVDSAVKELGGAATRATASATKDEQPGREEHELREERSWSDGIKGTLLEGSLS
jgi:hypothetical protein